MVACTPTSAPAVAPRAGAVNGRWYRPRVTTETLTLDTPDGAMGVHIERPDGDGPFAVIVYFHHGPGLDDGSKQSMRSIADAGYYVVSHDRYHRHQPWFVFDRSNPDPGARKAMLDLVLGTPDEQVDADLQAVLAHLAVDPAARSGAMGCIGFCIGARSVIRTLAGHGDTFAAGSGLHPSFCTTDEPDSPHLSVPSITGRVYAAFGSEDRSQSPADNVPFITAINALDGRGLAEVLDGADHGFGVPGPAYHPAAAKRAFQQTFAMFDLALR
jgi:carboxymethylenebutenolidase